MATPASGAISMNDMNVEILRAGGTATISMDTIRTRYGGSGAISFGDLYKSEGFTVTCGTYTSKFFSYDGWDSASFGGVGSVSPNETSGWVQFAANSYLTSMTAGTGSDTAAAILLVSHTNSDTVGITAGFKGGDVTRIVTANVSRSLGTSADNYRGFTYDMPSSGTISCLIKF
jgi:hypothetical protein